MDSIEIIINGVRINANTGETVLEAALNSGIYIPNLCFHPDLKPDMHAGRVKVPHLSVDQRVKNSKEIEFNIADKDAVAEGERCHKCDTQCRLCLVEIDGMGITTSCNTPVREGLSVKTDTPYIEDFRKTALQAIMDAHAGDCLTCAKNTRCKLQSAANYIGLAMDRPPRQPLLPIDDSHPFYTYDPNKCILCGICVMTCEEIVGVGAIDFDFREYNVGKKSIAESRCISCGECVSRCPVGALTAKHFQQPSREVSTVCTYCGVGCGLYLGVRGNKIVSVRSNRESPVNKGNLCVKGRFGNDFVNHPDRLKAPLIKKEGGFVEASWDEALDLVAKKLAQYKGDCFGVFSSARCTNEDNYLVQKFTRAVMRTNNVDHCARL